MIPPAMRTTPRPVVSLARYPNLRFFEHPIFMPPDANETIILRREPVATCRTGRPGSPCTCGAYTLAWW